MPFGNAAPLPFRLGENPMTSVSASQHARVAADLAAVSRTSAVMTLLMGVTWNAGTGTYDASVVEFFGKDGSGLQFSPAVGVGVEIDEIYYTTYVALCEYTNGYGKSVDFSAYAKDGVTVECVELNSGTTVAAWYDPVRARIRTMLRPLGEASYIFQITIYGTLGANIGDYGGHLLKKNSTTEGDETYAWTWYQMLLDATGSAYTVKNGTIRSWELMAHARALGTSQRISEMMSASSTPGGSDILLGRWAQWLGVQTAATPKWLVRQQCEQNFVGLNPVTDDSLEMGLATRLGSFFNSIRYSKTTSIEPTAFPAVYWPEYKNGDNAFNLADYGMRYSCRGHFDIVMNSNGLSGSDVLDKFYAHAFPYLNAVCSATDTFSPVTNVSGTGFTLGTSKLGVTAL